MAPKFWAGPLNFRRNWLYMMIHFWLSGPLSQNGWSVSLFRIQHKKEKKQLDGPLELLAKHKTEAC